MIAVLNYSMIAMRQSDFCPCDVNNGYALSIAAWEWIARKCWMVLFEKSTIFRSVCFTLDVAEGAGKKVYPWVKLLPLLKLNLDEPKSWQPWYTGCIRMVFSSTSCGRGCTSASTLVTKSKV